MSPWLSAVRADTYHKGVILESQQPHFQLSVYTYMDLGETFVVVYEITRSCSELHLILKELSGIVYVGVYPPSGVQN